MIDFKKLSIRVRMCYAIKCLQKTLIDRGMLNSHTNRIVDFLKTYTSSLNISEWESIANEIAPLSILDEHEDNNFDEYEHISKDYAKELKKIYITMPQYLLDLIDAVIDLGVTNLYGDTGEYSSLTYEALFEIIKILKDNDIEPPSMESLPLHYFDENNGWGYPFEMV